MVAINKTTLDQFSYLNSSKDVLISSEAFMAPVINTPYQMARSFYSAIVSQVNPSGSESSTFGSSGFLETASYFFSNYALGCFVTAVVLNRIVAMASLRSNSQVVRLPLWSQVLLHGLAIGALGYNIVLTLQILGEHPTSDSRNYFPLTYAIVCFSHCIETFLTITTNQKPMEEFDYSIFELSIHFHSLSRSSPQPQDYVPDCLMALLGRLIIHIVEVCHKRNRRLLFSTILNLCHLGYLSRRVYYTGVDSLPFLVRYRHFPKMLALFCTFVSVAAYALACIVRLNPFSTSKVNHDFSQLQFHSFMSNWYAVLNCTGEEEFTSTLVKLAIMICNPEQNKKFGLHRELSQLNKPEELHKSFLLSGYDNKWHSIPSSSINEDTPKPKRSLWRKRNAAIIDLLTAVFKRFKYSFMQQPEAQHQNISSESTGENLNDYVSARNYSRFLSSAPSVKVGSISPEDLRYLLPENDYSSDYAWSDEESVDDILEDSDYGDDETETFDAALADLILPPLQGQPPASTTSSGSTWFLSVWSILNCEMQHNKRLTRSQYSKINESGILREIMIERLSDSKTSSNATDKSDRDLACVVCKSNIRNIVLWPCKCFAVCEDCRVSLALRGFKTCICCRSEVRGYSKVNAV